MNMPFQFDETIAAIATAVAPGQGGIAVIRISGSAAKDIGRRILHISGQQNWESHRILYGYILDAEKKERIDEVLVLNMEAPRSYTGEDVVEIHCHGGLIPVQRVLERVLSHPNVRRALPGEFSQRAVLNNRLDLTQAEAINDLIQARSRKAAQLAMAGVSGELNNQINALRGQLLDQLTELEARVDFEDDLPPLNPTELLQEINNIKMALFKLVDDAKKGAYLRHGLKVALLGRPNVGKSSLLNRLSRRERAIVTELPGTTRDLLESEVILKGVPITLLDTAGIHQTDDQIEKLGIIRSKQALAMADVVMVIFDLSIGWTTEDHSILDQLPSDIPRLLVGNKSDLLSSPSDIPTNEFLRSISYVKISAITGKGEEVLINELLQSCGASEGQSLEIALNERQCDLAQLAAQSLDKISHVANQKLPWDFWTIDLREAIHKLGELTGEEITEVLLDRIFSRFCIGK